MVRGPDDDVSDLIVVFGNVHFAAGGVLDHVRAAIEERTERAEAHADHDAGVVDDLGEFGNQIKDLRDQMAANIEAAEVAGRSAKDVHAALAHGDEMWQWYIGQGSHSRVAPEALERTGIPAGARETRSARPMKKAVAELAAALAVARDKARSVHFALRRLASL